MSTSVSNENVSPETAPTLRWWSWPLRDGLFASLLVPLGILLLAALVGNTAGSWLTGCLALVITCGAVLSYLLPVEYQVDAGGFRRRILGRLGGARLIPWRLVRSFQPRATGIVLFRRESPVPWDAIGSHFLPYHDDADELLVAIRYYASHAEELPSMR